MTRKERNLRILLGGQKIANESGLMSDLMRGERLVKKIKPKSLIPILTAGLGSTSGIHDATLKELERIATETRRIAALN
jgi:hypothetical protein